MSVTKVFSTVDAEGKPMELTLRRPDYRSFKNIATKVSGLLEAEPEVRFASPAFEQVLQACVQENISDWLGSDETQGVDYAEVSKLWDAAIEHGEFIPFFEAQRKRYFSTSVERVKQQAQLQMAQIEAMKASGALPPDFSLANALSGDPLMSMPEFSTSTPASTGGRRSKSKPPTTGSSSATSRKPSENAKPESD